MIPSFIASTVVEPREAQTGRSAVQDWYSKTHTTPSRGSTQSHPRPLKGVGSIGQIASGVVVPPMGRKPSSFIAVIGRIFKVVIVCCTMALSVHVGFKFIKYSKRIVFDIMAPQLRDLPPSLVNYGSTSSFPRFFFFAK
jgi:hypothetical protein